MKERILLFIFLIVSTTETHAQVVSSRQRLFVFPDEIEESSGLSISKNNPGIFWTHNDSGNDPIVYGINPESGIVAKINLLGVEGRDLEDMASAPCSLETPTKYCLFIADIGDNLQARGTRDLDYPKVYIVEEPTLNDDSNAVEVYDVEPKVLRIYYSDNKSYDAEAFAITEDLDFLVITKGNDEEGLAKLYRLRYDDWRDNYDTPEPLLMDYEDSLFRVESKLNRVTAATYLNGILAVRTYLSIHFFNTTSNRYTVPSTIVDAAGNVVMIDLTTTDWVQSRPPCAVLELVSGAEALDMDHERIYLASENLKNAGGVHGILARFLKNSGAIVSLECRQHNSNDILSYLIDSLRYVGSLVILP